jgi:hypothetical protein
VREVGCRLQEPAPQQLREQQRPRGIRIAPVQSDASEAGRAAGHDERTDLRAAAREEERKVGCIVTHRRGRAVGGQRVMREQDARGRAIGEVRHAIAAVDEVDVQAAVFETGPHRLPRGVAGRSFEHDPRRRVRRVRADDGAQHPEERVAVAGGRTRGDGDDVARMRGETAFELVDELLLPGRRVVHAHDAVDAELENAVASPQRRMGGVQTQHRHHPPILASAGRGAAVVHRTRRRLRRPTVLGRSGR